MRVDARFIGVTTVAIAAGAIALTAVLMTGAGSAQTSPEASKLAAADRKTVTIQYGGWKVTCDETGDQSRSVCSAAFRVFDKNTNKTILTWLVGRSSDGRMLTEFYVPTEVLIEPGVSMVLEDGPAYRADFVACGRSACKAILALASELASATQATLSLTASNGKVTRFSMAIDGIDAALAELVN